MSAMKISVVIPVYNAGRYVWRCLNSLEQQKFQEIEFVLVNDGSTDNSAEICQEFCERDKRFKLINKPNGGSASARNRGLEEASGEYIVFVDSDDYVDEGFFDEMTSLLDKKTDVGVFAYQINGENQTTIRTYGVQTGIYSADNKNAIMSTIIAEDISGSRSITSALWSKIFRRELLLQNYKDVSTGVREGEDLLLVTACCNSAKQIQVFNENNSKYHYVLHAGQLTRNYDEDYEKRIPLLFNDLLAINKKQTIANFDYQFACLVVFFTCKCFENLFYRKRSSYRDAKKKISYICAMADYYCDLSAIRTSDLSAWMKLMLIKTKNSIFITFVYSKLGINYRSKPGV